MKKLIINRRGDFYQADEHGYISRSNWEPSAHWRITGAVEYRTVFGNQVICRRYSLADILAGEVPFHYKNGKQRCFITDYDHGSNRIWSGNHNVSVIG